MRFIRAQAAWLGLLLPIASVHGTLRPLAADPLRPPEAIGLWQPHVFTGQSGGWYWVYEGVAQGQSFIATGTQVDTLSLRIAQLNGQQPTAPLEVEIRSQDLQRIYAHGIIPPAEAGRQFHWVAAQLDHRTPLESGRTYVLLLHSTNTHHEAPWLVNAAFQNLYPDGRHLGYTDDLLFSITYRYGNNLDVGPSLTRRPQVPIHSGRKGGIPVATRPALSFGGRTCPTEAQHDPLGPIPEGQKAEVDVLLVP